MAVDPQLFAISSGLLPQSAEGKPIPRQYRREFDFTNGPSIFFDMYKEDANGAIDGIQCAFVDNGANANPLTIAQNEGTRYSVTIPKLTQGIFPLLCAKSPRFTISTTQAAIIIPIFFLNIPMPFDHWSLA